MKERFGSEFELRRHAEALRDAARHLDLQADALWLLAKDRARWGLGEDAEETRRQACELRVRALVHEAQAAGLAARLADFGDQAA